MKLAPTKREQNKLDRRRAIVDVAKRSFLDRGYAATSMSAIADQLGGSKATLWSHFTSKEELFTAVVDVLVGRFSEELEGTLTEAQFSLAGLRKFSLRFLRKLMDGDAIDLFRLIVAEGSRFPEIKTVFHTRGPAHLRRLLVAFFATRFSAENAERLAMVTISALAGYRAHVLTRPELPQPAEMEHFVDDFIAHLRLPEFSMESC